MANFLLAQVGEIKVAEPQGHETTIFFVAGG